MKRARNCFPWGGGGLQVMLRQPPPPLLSPPPFGGFCDVHKIVCPANWVSKDPPPRKIVDSEDAPLILLNLPHFGLLGGGGARKPKLAKCYGHLLFSEL